MTIGTGWAEGAWVDAGWVAEAWSSVVGATAASGFILIALVGEQVDVLLERKQIAVGLQDDIDVNITSPGA